jgi:AcrR family transcriptional regulator
MAAKRTRNIPTTAAAPGPAAASDARPETKGARTKALIKRVVADLVDEKGVDGVVLEDVCKRTELTIGAFYFHFGNKEAALEEVAIDSLETYYDGLIDAPENLNLYNEVHNILESSIEVHVRHPRMARLMYTMVPRSNRVYVHWLTARNRLIERLALAMARERDAGRADAAPVQPVGQDYLCAQYLLAGAEGFFENAFYGADPQFSKIDLKPANLVRDLAVLWYRSITAREPRAALVAEAHRRLARRLPATRAGRARPALR